MQFLLSLQAQPAFVYNMRPSELVVFPQLEAGCKASPYTRDI